MDNTIDQNRTKTLQQTNNTDAHHLEVVYQLIRNDSDPHHQAWSHLAIAVINAVPFAIMVTDAKAKIIVANTAFCDITGYDLNEVIGNNPRMFQSGRQSAEFYENMWLSIYTLGSWSGEIWNKNKSGRVYPEWITIKAIYDDDGVTSHYISCFEDISQRKAHEKQLKHIANHDYLTDLPNRMLLMDRLHQSLAHAQRSKKRVAVIFIDIDDFKPVNDQYGHDIGDLLLCEIAKRLKVCIRQSDTVARVGGDEFVVVVDQIHHIDDAYEVAQKVLISLCTVFLLQGHKINVGCSMGISECGYTADADKSAALILRQADTAMYQAKQSGRNRIVLFKQSFLEAG